MEENSFEKFLVGFNDTTGSMNELVQTLPKTTQTELSLQPINEEIKFDEQEEPNNYELDGTRKYRRWLVTEFNEEIVQSWRQYIEEIAQTVKYIQAQLELCPKTKRLHIQAYFETINRHGVGLQHAKSIWGNNEVHLEPWTQNECWYCSKPETQIEPYIEFGTRIENQGGDRKTFKHKTSQIINYTQKDMDELGGYEFLRAAQVQKTYNLLFPHNTKPIAWPEEKTKKRHIWLYGPSNAGKSYWYRQNYTFRDTYKVPYSQPTNWANYKGEKYLLLDEFKGQYTIQEINLMTEGTQWNVKGGEITVIPEQVIIISNYPPETCYHNAYDKDKSIL